MQRKKSTPPLTPAQKQANYRARKSLAQNQDSIIADAARILHSELLLNEGRSFVIPPQGAWEDTAVFLRNLAADLESARRKREKGGPK